MSARIIVGAAAAFLLAAIYAAPLFPGIYLAFRAVCHQAPERSFEWLGLSLPVCARCLGLYSGVLAAALRPASQLYPRLLAALVILNGLDWVSGFTGNEARFLLVLPFSWLSASYAIRLASRERAASN
jgi:formate-dependent nitrite reductase membrane component NrfD